MRRREVDFLTPDLTPLIDVVFLLLIFFLVSSVFKKPELALLLKLPSAESAVAAPKEKNQVQIELSNGSLAVNGKPLPIESLEGFIQDMDKSSLVFLRADRSTEYGRVIQVFDLLRKHKVEDVSLVNLKN